jgi:hypothetical protein
MKFGVLQDADLLNEIRMIQHNAVMPENRNAHNVTVLACYTHQRCQRIAQHVQR